jgi:hypothetical protein
MKTVLIMLLCFMTLGVIKANDLTPIDNGVTITIACDNVCDLTMDTMAPELIAYEIVTDNLNMGYFDSFDLYAERTEDYALLILYKQKHNYIGYNSTVKPKPYSYQYHSTWHNNLNRVYTT